MRDFHLETVTASFTALTTDNLYEAWERPIISKSNYRAMENK